MKKIEKSKVIEVIFYSGIVALMIGMFIDVGIYNYKANKNAKKYAIEKSYTVKKSTMFYTFYDNENKVKEIIGSEVVYKMYR